VQRRACRDADAERKTVRLVLQAELAAASIKTEETRGNLVFSWVAASEDVKRSTHHPFSPPSFAPGGRPLAVAQKCANARRENKGTTWLHMLLRAHDVGGQC
jgi:hypothetical protein